MIGNANGKYKFNTYDNLIGTIGELTEHFRKHVIRGRQLILSEGMSISNQLNKIKNCKDRQGIVCFFFPDDKFGGLELEKVYVLVREK